MKITVAITVLGLAISTLSQPLLPAILLSAVFVVILVARKVQS